MNYFSIQFNFLKQLIQVQAPHQISCKSHQHQIYLEVNQIIIHKHTCLLHLSMNRPKANQLQKQKQAFIHQPQCKHLLMKHKQRFRCHTHTQCKHLQVVKCKQAFSLPIQAEFKCQIKYKQTFRLHTHPLCKPLSEHKQTF